jgi:phosphatidylinositol 4-kinase A
VSRNELPTLQFSALDVLTQLIPAIHGLYRAITSTIFPWTTTQWEQLSAQCSILCAPDIVDLLNLLLVDIFQREDVDFGTLHFLQTFVARYVSRGRPLSGSFIVCCVMETQWTVLAQALFPPQATKYGSAVEAAAANSAWLSLTRHATANWEITDDKIKDALKATANYAMQCFTDLLVQLDELDSEPSVDTYAWETMSESLVCHHSLPPSLAIYTSLYRNLPLYAPLPQETLIKICSLVCSSY